MNKMPKKLPYDFVECSGDISSRLGMQYRKERKEKQEENPIKVNHTYYQSVKAKQILGARTAVQTLTMTVSYD